MKKSKPSPAATPSPVQTQALNVSEQERQSRNQMIDQTQPALNRYTTADATGTTPFRRALTQTKEAAVNTGSNNALVAARTAALRNGLQNQPLQAGNEVALENQRAQRLAEIPNQVEQEAIGPEMEALGLQTNQAHLYNPEGYFSTGAGLEEQRQGNLNSQWLDAQRRKGGLWKGLAKVGLAAAAPFTGGATLPMMGAF